MKKLYHSPVLDVISFAPVEHLAAGNDVDFDDLLNANGPGSEAKPSAGDIDIEL